MSNMSLTIQKAAVTLIALVFFCCPAVIFGDIEFDGGITAEINYQVDGSVWIYDATVAMYNPAHVMGFVGTGSGAVLDIYGGQIDWMLLISTDDQTLPEGVVTVYGTDFAVDGVPVSPDTTELFLQGEYLSGVYEDGTFFEFPVDCVIVGGGGTVYYQTIRLGWLTSSSDIELSHNEYDFGQTYIGDTQIGAVTIYNLGDAALTVQSLSIEQDDYGQFSIPLVALPFTLDPNSGVDIEILYTPAVEGSAQATFSVFSDDPNDPYVITNLIGEGIPLPPEQQIQDIIDVYDAAVSDGSILGVGNKKSAVNKLEAFGKMLSVVDGLIAGDYDDYAVDALLMIEAKCDGERSPKDFIEGPAAEELNTRINELIDTLQE